jgi:hypothetical protein
MKIEKEREIERQQKGERIEREKRRGGREGK